VEVSIAALGVGSDGVVDAGGEVSLDDDPSVESPESLLEAGGEGVGSELGGAVVVVVVVVVVGGGEQTGEPVGEVPAVESEFEPDDVVATVPGGQAGSLKTGASPKKATRSVEMLVGSSSVT
jgi:hypothetical protein